jgi:hypothetical protein
LVPAFRKCNSDIGAQTTEMWDVADLKTNKRFVGLFKKEILSIL